MTLQPIFQPRKPVWRGNSSSKDMNLNFDEILYDLNTIFSEASSQAIELNELGSIMKHEIDAINERIQSVSGVLVGYEISASGYKMAHEEFYRANNIVYPTSLPIGERCIADTEFGVVTLPIVNSYSKVYTTNINTGEIYQAADLLAVSSALNEDGNVLVEETSTLRAFNGNNQSYWERKVRFDRDYVKNEVTCKLDITVPSVSSPNVNSFYIMPYPEGKLELSSITYDTTASQNLSLPTFPIAGELSAIKKKYTFDDIQPIRFTLSFKQSSSAIEENFKTFTYGAQEIGLEKVDYNSNGKIGIKFKLPDWDNFNYNTITLIKTSPEYDNIYYKLSLYVSQSNFDANVPAWTSSNSPITSTNKLDISANATDTVWILVELTQVTGSTATPLLDNLTMTYTTA